ncbi:MAG TPA: hypothetical protein PLP08_10050 [Plasticicumulans sp.]|uniref:hypothetical protein n=1 Tax=Plasticicumulans sp. TaxID=2307179 RepID=UPI002C47BF8B|nr:hypothetical protein [Plasticicumulans sp.]HMV38426.1 hypothetical protein [Plasticicumulans sp.]HMW29714.1 hypothetical protein [Plasticicumulans sp.]HMW42438.1 hypothetical protein [Plasticicumulans sp.]HMZ09644.1 hypothetical protein [Plasticicumulans sp.]HNG49926.1 hypothetical protein [Plasticicumulans sp.]
MSPRLPTGLLLGCACCLLAGLPALAAGDSVRRDELFGLIPTGTRTGSNPLQRADQQTCDELARRARLAADIGNRAGQQDSQRQQREAGCP